MKFTAILAIIGVVRATKLHQKSVSSPTDGGTMPTSPTDGFLRSIIADMSDNDNDRREIRTKRRTVRG